ncbi:MAG: thioredoxin TrxC [Marinomonas sp.]
MTDSVVQIICQNCSTKNRLPKLKLNAKPLCGKCGQYVLSETPIVGESNNFSRFVTYNDLPVVVDFWAPWCGPCQQFAPIFEQVTSEMFTQACFVKLDTESNQNISGAYAIRSIPTLMIFHHGKEIARLSGALPKQQFKQWVINNLPAI